MRKLSWSYGVTTVEGRRSTLLPRTLQSLKVAGFDNPRLFVDGSNDIQSWEKEFGLEVTVRTQNIKTFGNWIMALWELYLRNPAADRYALFQDDFVTSLNLKKYLEKTNYPLGGYCNLYTFPQNQSLAPKTKHGGTVDGWYRSNQMGRGAVALVFSNEATRVLLTSQHMVERPRDANRGWKAIDGGIVTAFKKAGWYEFVHSPSLVQHIGDVSSMGNKPHLKAESFRGENFDLLSLLSNAP